ncbi:hypothetical protein L3Q82_023603 [Scortum barcoo]|uniref:Uncharacterized protein n=1 Tax=Scortum barcoo TaxID=214431 RepID=A0ACB8WVJ9_9TELE|nr:hypothetical protein L3Q82_023603 [Scortum barcoo]
MEELVAALTRLQREYRECSSLMHFTETLAEPPHPGLTAGAAGRISSRQSGQEYKGERDIELLAEGVFTCHRNNDIHIPPSANADAACELLHSVVAQLQTEHPQAFLLITGDFNHASLSATLPNFHQSQPGPSARPVYTPMVKRQPPNKRRVKQWSEEASDALRDCFDTTDWEVLCGPHEQDIDSLTECITDYINFCVERITFFDFSSAFNTIHPSLLRVKLELESGGQ